jgi:glycine cleavage system transcriptional repressor
MTGWFMLTVVGEDRPGIVARLTAALYDGGCNLGEASMLRLGGNFTIMLMVQCDSTGTQLAALVEPVTRALGLRLHVDPIEGRLHQHIEPDVSITVAGADRAGIVAQAVGALAAAGLNILNLESGVGGSADRPLYIMHIEGQALQGMAALQTALEIVRREGIDVSLTPVATLIG